MINTLFPDQKLRQEGFSVIELLIVVAMVGTVVGFALLQIAQARQNMTRTNAAREFASYLEKARLNSVKRHPVTTAQMAQITIINSTFYSVTLDTDADGVMDAPRVINLPPDSGLSFNGPFPRTIMFNWRGRTVDATNAVVTPTAVTISNSYGSNTINITSSGQSALDMTIPTDPVSNSTAPTASFRGKTQVTP